jgi:hypothetical protein
MFLPHFVGDDDSLMRTVLVEPVEYRHNLLALLGSKVDVSKLID